MKHSLFLVLCVFVYFHPCSAQDHWDLERCIRYALQHNTSIQLQEIQAKSDELRFRQASASKFPAVSFSSSLGLNTGRSIDATTNQFTTQSIFYNGVYLQTSVDIFNFYSKRNTIAAVRYAAEASAAGVDKLEFDVSLNVLRAYLQVLLNQQQAEISMVQVQQRVAQLSNTRKRVQSGSLPELNLVQLEAEVMQDSTNLVIAEGLAGEALLHLKRLLNLDAATVLHIKAPIAGLISSASLSHMHPEDIYQRALMNLPQQRIDSLQLKSAQNTADAAKGALYPSITLSGTLQTGYSNAKNQAEPVAQITKGYNEIGVVKGTGTPVIAPIQSTLYHYFADPFSNQLSNNFGNGISIGITIPVFNGALARTKLLKAKLEVKSYELYQQQHNLSLKQDIYKAHTDAVTSMQKASAAAKNLEAARNAFDFATKRYNMGLLTALDLITVQNNLFGAKLQQVSAHYENIFMMKILERFKVP